MSSPECPLLHSQGQREMIREHLATYGLALRPSTFRRMGSQSRRQPTHMRSGVCDFAGAVTRVGCLSLAKERQHQSGFVEATGFTETAEAPQTLNRAEQRVVVVGGVDAPMVSAARGDDERGSARSA